MMKEPKAVVREECNWLVPPRVDARREEYVQFSSSFDSGNCGPVSLVAPWTFEVSTVPDNAGTEFETHNRTWFYFSISNVPKNQKVSIRVKGMNNQKQLYEKGFKPVMRSFPSNPKWSRIPGAVYLDVPNKQECSITFSHLFIAGEKERVYFAFCYPYSFEDCQRKLRSLEKRFSLNPNQLEGGLDVKVEHPEANGKEKEVYFHRTCLAYSLQGRPIEILTVTNAPTVRNKTMELDFMKPYLKQHPYLLPERDGTSCERFIGKPIIFVSSRVHPGETPASFCFDGFLDFLLDIEDPRADKLRDLFVFKLVPILNPDGVALGHYRTNTLGINLNRFYHTPDPSQHPSIAAVRALLIFYSKLVQWSSVYMYLDMHAHASKRGCFLFGNYYEDVNAQVENVLYSNLVALNTPYLDLSACDFSRKNMAMKDKCDASVSKEGAGRVALHRATGISKCYTLECNYNCGKSLNDVALAMKACRGRKKNDATLNETKRPRTPSPPRSFSTSGVLPHTVFYDPDTWRDVGKACAIALLDLEQQNPWSRLERSSFKSLEGVRSSIMGSILASRQKDKKKKQQSTTIKPRKNMNTAKLPLTRTNSSSFLNTRARSKPLAARRSETLPSLHNHALYALLKKGKY